MWSCLALEGTFTPLCCVCGCLLDHWDVLCFGPWNDEFALGESGWLWQFPIQDGRVISNPWCLASPRGSLQALNFPITQQNLICLIPDISLVFPPASLCVLSRPGWSKGDLGEGRSSSPGVWEAVPPCSELCSRPTLTAGDLVSSEGVFVGGRFGVAAGGNQSLVAAIVGVAAPGGVRVKGRGQLGQYSRPSRTCVLLLLLLLKRL